MLKQRSVVLLLVGLLPLAVQAASYDCTQASTDAEIAVCDHPDLNALDEGLALSYRALLKELPARQSERMQQDQRSWLKARDTCASDVRCLKARYQERISRLNEY